MRISLSLFLLPSLHPLSSHECEWEYVYYSVNVDVRRQPYISPGFLQDLFLVFLLYMPGHLATSFWGFFHLHLLTLLYQLLCWFWGPEFRSSCLIRKCLCLLCLSPVKIIRVILAVESLRVSWKDQGLGSCTKISSIRHTDTFIQIIIFYPKDHL